MKKAGAMKILAVVLAMVMVLGTSIGAMAASVTSTTKYVDGGYNVTTSVSGLNADEMVTYLVSDADSLYQVGPGNIEYVDQQTAQGTTAQFSYTGTGDEFGANKKIYVGAQSLEQPIESENTVLQAGAVLMENGKISTAENTDLTNTEGTLKTITLSNSSNLVTSVYKNDQEIDFFKTADGIAVTCEITENDVIYVSYQMPEILSSAAYIDQGRANTTYETLNATGSVASLNGIASHLQGNTIQGESSEYWFIPQKWTGQEITFKYDVAKKADIAADESVPQNIKDAVAADTENTGSVTVIFTDYQPYGITLHSNDGQYIVYQDVYVPVSGTYNLVTRTNSYAADRKPAVEIWDGNEEYVIDRVEATPTVANQWSLGKGDHSVDLDAGYYTIKIKSTNNIIRFDFAALMPADPAAEAALASQDAFMDYVAQTTDAQATAEIRLGTVTLSDTALTAFARVIGNYTECGINVNGKKYQALGVSGNGAFAVGLEDEAGGLSAEFAEAQVSAYADGTQTAPGVITTVE